MEDINSGLKKKQEENRESNEEMRKEEENSAWMVDLYWDEGPAGEETNYTLVEKWNVLI